MAANPIRGSADRNLLPNNIKISTSPKRIDDMPPNKNIVLCFEVESFNMFRGIAIVFFGALLT